MSDFLHDPGPVDEISQESGHSVRGLARAGAPLSRGAKLTALTTALSLVLVGGVVTAAWHAFQTHHSAEALVPSSAFAIATVDLGMPDGQAAALRSFADHFPGSPTHHGDGSAVDRLLRAILRQSSDPHVDYDRDLKPWLGDHIALAGWLDSAGKPQMEAVIETTDTTKARAELAKLVKHGDGAFRFSDGYAVIGNNDAKAREAVDAARKSSLAGSSRYSDDIDALPGHPAMTAWMDGPGVRRAIESALGPNAKMLERMGPMGPLGMFGPMGLVGAAGTSATGLGGGAMGAASAALAGRTAMGVIVADRYVEIDSRSTVGAVQHQSSTAQLRALPATTIGAVELGDPSSLVTAATSMMSMFGGVHESVSMSCGEATVALPPDSAVPLNVPNRRRILRELYRKRQLSRAGAQPCEAATPPRPVDPLKQLEASTGLKLPSDATTVLGDSLLASYGGLTVQGMPKVAVRTHPADLSAARAVVDRVQARLGSSARFPLAVDTSGDDLLLGTSQDYVHEVEQAGTLGDQPQVQLSLGDIPAAVASAGYVDLSKILPLVGAPRDLQTLKAVGFWTAADHGVQLSQMRIVVG